MTFWFVHYSKCTCLDRQIINFANTVRIILILPIAVTLHSGTSWNLWDFFMWLTLNLMYLLNVIFNQVLFYECKLIKKYFFIRSHCFPGRTYFSTHSSIILGKLFVQANYNYQNITCPHFYDQRVPSPFISVSLSVIKSGYFG